MGYACPVCEEPQADGEHLANHLAFSALLGRADHADWLDEHAPGWGEEGPEELAERVTPHAEKIDLPGMSHDHDADLPDQPAGSQARRGSFEDALARQGGHGREPLDPETRRIVEEARELTRQRRAGSADASAGDVPAGTDDGEEESDDEGADEKG